MGQALDAKKATILEAVIAELPEEGGARSLAPLLFARPPAEDLAAFDKGALPIAVQSADRALGRYTSGDPEVVVEEPEGFTLSGEAQQLVTIVNRDMAFLFDSVAAEIAAREGVSLPEIAARVIAAIEADRAARGGPTPGPRG